MWHCTYWHCTRHCTCIRPSGLMHVHLHTTCVLLVSSFTGVHALSCFAHSLSHRAASVHIVSHDAHVKCDYIFSCFRLLFSVLSCTRSTVTYFCTHLIVVRTRSATSQGILLTPNVRASTLKHHTSLMPVGSSKSAISSGDPVGTPQIIASGIQAPNRLQFLYF